MHDSLINQQDQEDQLAQDRGDHNMARQEKALEANFDAFVTDYAKKKLNYNKNIPWAEVTKVTLIVYLVVTCFSCYYRPDFMSLTAITMGIYAVECPHFFRRWVFRLLVVFMVLTMVFDFLHLVILHDSGEDDEMDCDLTKNVRRFSYFFAWVSFLMRPIVILVFWKDSLDFMKIIKQRSDENHDVLFAMQKYG